MSQAATARRSVLTAVSLTADDLTRTDQHLRDLAATGLHVTADDDLRPVTALDPPARLADALADVRAGIGAPALLVRRPPLTEPVGPTPPHWSADRVPTPAHDLWLALLAETVGRAVCWSSLQAGRLVADVLPVRGDELAQTGAGSAAELDFHVEDAFDADRCDHLLLLALRNPDRVPTTVAAVRPEDLPPEDIEVLGQPRFVIRPDPEHLRGPRPRHVPAPKPTPVLSIHRDQPRLRLDPAYTAALDPAAGAALARLGTTVERQLVDVVIAPSDVLVVDNRRAVHGRRAFRARFDGTDRWLRKMTTRRDLSAVAPRLVPGTRRLATW